MSPAQNAQGLPVPRTVALYRMEGTCISSLLGQRRTRVWWPDSKMSPMTRPHPGIHTFGWSLLASWVVCDRNMEEVPYVTSRLGYKRRCDFLSLSCSLPRITSSGASWLPCLKDKQAAQGRGSGGEELRPSVPGRVGTTA